MAIINLPFESLLSNAGIGQWKALLDQILANPQDSAEIVFEHLRDQTDLPLKLPVDISKDTSDYLIQAAQNLIDDHQDFFIQGLESVLTQFRIRINETTSEVEEILIEGRTQLQSLRDQVTNELAKIPYRFQLGETNGSKVFVIAQTQPIPCQIQGLALTITSSSLTFSVSEISQLQLAIEAQLPGLQNQTGTGPHIIALELNYEAGVFSGSASNIPLGRLQGFQATIDQLDLVFQNGDFQPGTQVNGELIFDFLDDTAGGPGKIDYSVELLGNGDVRYHAQNPSGNELKKGSISIHFEQIEVITHLTSPPEVEINGWAELPGIIDTSTQQPAKTTFELAYSDSIFEFSGTNFSPIPLGFGTATFETVFMRIHKNGNLVQSTWDGNLQLPFFSNGQLDFLIEFENQVNDLLSLSVSTSQVLAHGGFLLNVGQYEMMYEGGVLQDISGNGQLTLPAITNGTPVNIDFQFTRTGQTEHLSIAATDFGTPVIAGCQVDFSKIEFQFQNGTFTQSDITGKIKLPDSTGGAGINFELEIADQGNDYLIRLVGEAQDNLLNFGPIILAFDTFEMEVVNSVLDRISGGGQMQVPGLSESFSFSFDASVDGDQTVYEILINNVIAELNGFNLNFSLIRLSSQASQQFSANATGSLTLPVFDQGGRLDFDLAFERDESYQIAVNSGTQLLSFGDFELSQVAITLNVQSGILHNFSGSGALQIPGFDSPSLVSIEYTNIDERYLIQLENPLDLDLFGGQIQMDDLTIEILDGNFISGSASGVFKLPDTTGGAGIQYQLEIDDSGQGYSLQLTGTPDQNTLEFGPVILQFQNFSLVVENGVLQSVTGSGDLELPGLNQPFNFNISVNTSLPNPVYIIELTNVSAELDSFNLHFDQIRIESEQNVDFQADISGEVTLPVFDGNPIGFSVAVSKTNDFAILINGEGQSSNFGMFVLQDVVFSIQVTDAIVQNANGAAKFHIPELTPPDDPFEVEIEYSKNGTEDFSISATDFPPVNLAIFSFSIDSLSFLIQNGAFHSGNLAGSLAMPIFEGELDFALEILAGGNQYTIQISSSGVLEGNGLEIQELNLLIDVRDGSLHQIAGTSEFKLPGGAEFIEVSLSYHSAEDKLEFSTANPPEFTIAGLIFDFSSFGFAIQNGILVDGTFAGELTIPVCDSPNNKLGFNFELSDGNNYTIQANPGGGRTTLKLGDVSLHIGKFDLVIQGGDLESIDAEAALGFSGFEEEDGSGPSEIGIGFSYEKSGGLYEISLSQDKKIKVGGFAFTIKKLELAFTADTLTYPFFFEGELEIPGLKDDSDQQAKLEVIFSITNAGSFTGQVKSTAVFHLGSVKITISDISVSKAGQEITIRLQGELELEGIGEGTAIGVDIEIDNQGAFSVLGTATPALKVLDLSGIVRIYLSKIALSRTSANDWDFGLGGLIENQIVIPGMDNLLPSQINLKDLMVGSAFNIDLDIRWPSGLSISFGGAQSEALIPVNGKFGNAVSLDAIKLSFKNNGTAGAEIGVSFSGASITLGPVAASVEGLGIEAILTRPSFTNGFPQGSANFGIINIDIRFKPPTGLGVSLDTPVFTGGGYLFFDRDKGEYAGAVELSFLNLFAVSAIGIINSKMPDGKPGTSVLFIVSVEFGTGIALGFGFFLSGLGGILGIHRTIQVERLRDGVRSGTIQNILFPKDIIANINKILTDIKEVFPVKRDQFVLGPMAAITWGVPTILRVDLGLVIEFANPVRFGILGVLRVILPDENAALIKIQVAFLGLIDFEKGMLSFDASLFDSKVLTFGLEGDMVLRISWGAKPDFVLSVGGFHPRFSPPAHLQIPVMKRLTLKILSGNPRLTLTCYLAVTSNTVQFGAGIDFYFGVSGFSIVGEFGFDVLFQFSPFWFIADARARLAVKAGGATILSLSLEFSLEGPTPWRAKGTAKFKILFFSVKAKFDTTWGDRKDTALPDIAVFPLLTAAMEDIQNWRSVLSNSNSPGLRMKGLSEGSELILTPNGSIEISQKVVPLKVEISKFGQFKPADFTQFEVIEVKIGSTVTSYSYIREAFAPANFLDIDDNEKLSLPAFNEQDSGVKLSGTDTLKTGAVIDREVEYEQLLMDEVNLVRATSKLDKKVRFKQLETTFFSRTGSVGRSALSANQSKILNPNKVKLQKPGFSVVGTDELEAVNGATKLTYMEAVQIAKFSSAKKSVQVVASDVLAL